MILLMIYLGFFLERLNVFVSPQLTVLFVSKADGNVMLCLIFLALTLIAPLLPIRASG